MRWFEPSFPSHVFCCDSLVDKARRWYRRDRGLDSRSQLHLFPIAQVSSVDADAARAQRCISRFVDNALVFEFGDEFVGAVDGTHEVLDSHAPGEATNALIVHAYIYRRNQRSSTNMPVKHSWVVRPFRMREAAGSMPAAGSILFTPASHSLADCTALVARIERHRGSESLRRLHLPPARARGLTDKAPSFYLGLMGVRLPPSAPSSHSAPPISKKGSPNMQTFDTRSTPIRSAVLDRTPQPGLVVELPAGLLYMNEFYAQRALNAAPREVRVTDRRGDEFFWVNGKSQTCSAYFKLRSSR
jgi:hypothetical protein